MDAQSVIVFKEQRTLTKKCTSKGNEHTRHFRGMPDDPGTPACGRNRGGDAPCRAPRLFGLRCERCPDSLSISWLSTMSRLRSSGSGDSGMGATGFRISQYHAGGRSWNSAARRSQKTPVASFSVRGPDRHWHRYAIFQDRIEAIEICSMSASRHLGQQTLQVG